MSSHKTYLSKFQEELGLQVELGDDATYLVVGIYTIPFYMPLGYASEMHDVLFVSSLTLTLLFLSPIIDLNI